MACIGSSRLCARAEKLCQFGHLSQIRKKLSTTFTKSRAEIERVLTSNVQQCQNRTTTRGGLCRIGIARSMSSMQTIQPGSLPDYQIDPYRLVEDDLKLVYHQIRSVLDRYSMQDDLREIAKYYFSGQGKAIRPMFVILMGRAINYHKDETNTLTNLQRSLAMYVEMIHNASLLHDDVIDQAECRRGKPSANVLWNQQQVTLAGNYILTVATMLLARHQHDEITITLVEIISDLVKGELMQLGSKETENERFAHYLNKTFRKTASMMANSLKATAQAAEVNDEIKEIAYHYGRNIGIAFQLVDDFLDFVASSAMMGKKTAVDLKLGLATAPVLFACEKYPELNAMIMRRFQEPTDVEKAYELVHKSHGLDQTKFLAKKHCAEAVRLIQSLAESPYQKALIVLSDLVINRIK
ncbi:all trans-polyprenyl-diphosphate synthase PDSS1 [Polistes fuscatus]|uniref:all trans-polyprenyl-diphosphate synthase PDSS1 n=1 Tax=Polistes fuscatus TaxID=30207 RepID=UPI001CA99759|nr:all trans-polyprenyl-diphosphate synthase PDSS1 [Polistes fuscatus]